MDKLTYGLAVQNQIELGNKLDASLKGAVNGLAELDASGLVPASQLPSYVDDVLEVATYSALPGTGETGKIYIVVADETKGGDVSTYRWSGSVYVLVTNTLDATDVKTLYESNANTNAYDDIEKAKVARAEGDSLAFAIALG